MNPAYSWLIGVIILVFFGGVGIPLIAAKIREKDFKDQISGKKEERTLDDGFKIYHDRADRTNAEMESMKVMAELKSKQNILGPK